LTELPVGFEEEDTEEVADNRSEPTTTTTTTTELMAGGRRGPDDADSPFREPRCCDGSESAKRPNTSKDTRTVIIEYKADDPWGPYMIQERVAGVVERWGALNAINPDEFLRKLLSSRGYHAEPLPPPKERRLVWQQLSAPPAPTRLRVPRDFASNPPLPSPPLFMQPDLQRAHDPAD